MASGTKTDASADPKEVTRNDKGAILNPWTCLAVKNEKYAKECSEVYLCGKSASQISAEFRRFPSVEVIWFNHNRLTRLHNLEANFRIQEVYIEHNRLVSLKGLLPFKFLRVLLARGNQLRNLDKQIGVLAHFSFLKRLDLSENAVADEPDYQLRVIYNLPQVEELDRKSVKQHERIKAGEVVPNLDKVTEKAPGHVTKKFNPSQQYSDMERHCFQEAKALKQKYKREEEAAKQARYAASASWLELYQPKHLPTEAWQNARAHEQLHLSAWEASEVQHFLFQRYCQDVDPQGIIAQKLDKTRAIGEVMNTDAPKPVRKEETAKDGSKSIVWEETAKMKEDKGKAKDEVAKMKAKQLSFDECMEIIDVLNKGEDVMLGRILTDPLRLPDEMQASTKKSELSESLKEDQAKRAFWGFTKDGDGTTSLHDLYKWAITLHWSWEEDSVLDERIAELGKRAIMADILMKAAVQSGDKEEERSKGVEARCFSGMMNRMDGVKTRKRELLMVSKHAPPDAKDQRVDFLPLINFGRRTTVDPVSGRTSTAFTRNKSEFRYPTCR